MPQVFWLDPANGRIMMKHQGVTPDFAQAVRFRAAVTFDVAPVVGAVAWDFTGASDVSVYDSTFKIKDNTTPTKIMQFQLSGLSAGTSTKTIADGNDTIVELAATQSLSNKTIGSSTLSQNNIVSDEKVLVVNAAYTSSATLAPLTGMSWTVTASGVYKLEMEGAVTMTTNGGLSMALKYTTATMTAVSINAIQMTASAIAVAANFTTATDEAKFIDQKATAYTYVKVSGALFVNAGGTVAIEAAQNTSHGDTTMVFKGFRARLVRVS